MSIGAHKRAAIIARDDSTCYLCHRKLEADEITLDHVTPKSRGGTDAGENLKVACLNCNEIKGERLPGECAASEFIPDKPPMKIQDAESQRTRDKLTKANQRLRLAHVVIDPNTPQSVIDMLTAVIETN
jgi:5-methylcytosine-specific restriction endonuclease McrA